MRMSDLVAQYIIEMLDRENGSAEIQRNELAGNLGCVPSQINYVITSRFTPEQKEKGKQIIARMGLEGLESRSIGQLSGGQLQRALLGRAIISDPAV